ncbi:hypothetical protein AC1031_002257 [Aphanomyces cochlioides]|nr:hypothetical protein AC1031_002257 [Aphanomyces cochlioides]
MSRPCRRVAREAIAEYTPEDCMPPRKVFSHPERLEIPFPSRLAARIVGTHGCNMKRIDSACDGLRSCRVVDRRRGHVVSLVGTTEAVQKASILVKQLVESLSRVSNEQHRGESVGFVPHFGVRLLRFCGYHAVDLKEPSVASAHHLDLIAQRPSQFGRLVLEETATWLYTAMEPEPWREVPKALTKLHTAVVGSFLSLDGYLRLIFNFLGTLAGMERHYVTVSIGKSYFRPSAEIDMKELLLMDDMATKLSTIQTQFSTGDLTNAHFGTAQSWCRANGFVPAPCTRQSMTVHVLNKTTKTRVELSFRLPENSSLLWKDVVDLSTLTAKAKPAPHRLGFITSHEPGEENLEYRVAFKALKSDEDVDDGLLSRVIAAWNWHRTVGGNFQLDGNDEYEVNSVRSITSNVWTNAFHKVALDRVTQSWRCPSDEVTFWTITMTSPVVERAGWLALSKAAFVDEAMQMVIQCQGLVNELNHA